MLNLKDKYRRKVQKSLAHLQYSYDKVLLLSTDMTALDEETLETWESFTARFSRAVDLFLSKYLKAVVLENDPGFQGSLRDFVDQGEKLGVVDSADKWMELRKFRNLIAHEYEEEELGRIFREMRDLTPQILSVSSKFT
jgi:hypothetical protein